MTRDDYSSEDWKLMVSAPSLVGLAVSAASPSGPLGVVKEMFAVGMSIADLATEHPNNALIQAVVEDIRHHDSKTLVPDPAVQTEGAKTWALIELARVSDLLGADEDSTEAFEFRRWLVAIAERVAQASREGGFLGIGGEKVDDAEQAALDEVRAALGMA